MNTPIHMHVSKPKHCKCLIKHKIQKSSQPGLKMYLHTSLEVVIGQEEAENYSSDESGGINI